MRVSLQCLPDHLPNPYIGKYNETTAGRYAALLDMAVLAERHGYWAHWIGEHHAQARYLTPSPHMVLAAIAARTKRLKLGAGVVVLPLCNPIRVAEDYAVLDQISNGRAILGVGSGIMITTYDLFGEDPAAAGAMSQEKLDAIIRLWSAHDVNAPAGRFVPEMKAVTLNPRTVSDACLPIYRACAREETAIDAGKRGHRLSLHTVAGGFEDKSRRFADLYRETYLKAGHDPKNMSVGVIIMTYCGTGDGDRLRKHWRVYLENYFASGNAIRAEKQAQAKASGAALQPEFKPGEHPAHIGGTPDDILEMLADRYRTIGGWDELNLITDNGGIPGSEVLDSIACFGEMVIPRLHEIDGRSASVNAPTPQTLTAS